MTSDDLEWTAKAFAASRKAFAGSPLSAATARRLAPARALARRTRTARARAARALARGTFGRCPLAPGSGLLAATTFLVHRGPRTAFGLLLRRAAIFVAFLDVLGLALLLGR